MVEMGGGRDSSTKKLCMDNGRLLLCERDLNASEYLELRLLQGRLNIGEQLSLRPFLLSIVLTVASPYIVTVACDFVTWL